MISHPLALRIYLIREREKVDDIRERVDCHPTSPDTLSPAAVVAGFESREAAMGGTQSTVETVPSSSAANGNEKKNLSPAENQFGVRVVRADVSSSHHPPLLSCFPHPLVHDR
jgi:hypothetical protein